MPIFVWLVWLLWWLFAQVRFWYGVVQQTRLSLRAKSFGRRRGTTATKDERFKPKLPQRRSGGKPKPSWMFEWALEKRRRNEWGYQRVAKEFNREFSARGLYLSASTVKNWVHQRSAEALEIRRATRNRFPRPAPANLRWCLDATGKVDLSGTEHFILGIMDFGSRVCVKLLALEDGTSAAILKELFEAINRLGKPTIIRTDNASVFHSQEFKAALKAAGIRQEFTEKGKPWQNRIERFFWTLKDRLNLIVPTDFVALNSLLSEFTFWYNEVRPHQHLHGWTPAEVWTGINPYETTPRAVSDFSGWGGMLTGRVLHRYPLRH